jgi:hypothetical protein
MVAGSAIVEFAQHKKRIVSEGLDKHASHDCTLWSWENR